MAVGANRLDGMVMTAWFDRDGAFHHDAFDPDASEVVEEDA